MMLKFLTLFKKSDARGAYGLTLWFGLEIVPLVVPLGWPLACPLTPLVCPLTPLDWAGRPTREFSTPTMSA